ncbi:MAG: DUF2058 family protein [Thioalkalivibrionaceae bacterium]
MNDLRTQLLKAGLVSQDKARKAAKKPRKPKPRVNESTTAAVDAAREAQAEATRAANRARDEAKARRARAADIQKWIEDHHERLPDRLAAEQRGIELIAHHYASSGQGKPAARVITAHVTPAQRERLLDGRLRLTRYRGVQVLISAATAARIEALDPSWPLSPLPKEETPPEDDPYADYTVPDDLIW